MPDQLTPTEPEPTPAEIIRVMLDDRLRDAGECSIRATGVGRRLCGGDDAAEIEFVSTDTVISILVNGPRKYKVPEPDLRLAVRVLRHLRATGQQGQQEVENG